MTIILLTDRFAAHDLGHQLSKLNPQSKVARAIREARYWEAFPNAYTTEAHQLGLQLVNGAGEVLKHYTATGRLPSTFTDTVRAILAYLDQRSGEQYKP